jgi:beta-lactamase class A
MNQQLNPPVGLVSRRALLQLCTAFPLLVGVGNEFPAWAATEPVSGLRSWTREFAELEAAFGGRIGLWGLDTATGRSISYRAPERFAMCSTVKVLVAAAILYESELRPGLLNQLRFFTAGDVTASGYAPITSDHVDSGMTVAELCAAAIEYSDNCAANVLLRELGGPDHVTAFARSLGDRFSRLDRIEPDLNEVGPGEQRDTSTPEAMGRNLHSLLLGEALTVSSRRLLTGWLLANTTGDECIRAGLPPDWRVGDKTGSGSYGARNDLAIAWPPKTAPVILSIYTVKNHPADSPENATIATATRIAINHLRHS